jgi:hypothetical protein
MKRNEMSSTVTRLLKEALEASQGEDVHREAAIKKILAMESFAKDFKNPLMKLTWIHGQAKNQKEENMAIEGILAILKAYHEDDMKSATLACKQFVKAPDMYYNNKNGVFCRGSGMTAVCYCCKFCSDFMFAEKKE